MVRLGEEALTAEFCGDLFVAGELLAVIKRKGLNDLFFEQTQDLGSSVIDFDDRVVARAVLEEIA